jgi:predicted secreted acid phosphatase
MKYRVLFLISFLSVNIAFAGNHETCVPGDPQSNQIYNAVQWYRDAAESKALYREIFFMAGQSMSQKVQAEQLKPKTWGVVFDIDETLLDNSLLAYQYTLTCTPRTADGFSRFAMHEVSVATPGAVKITCMLQKMGGYVTLISNRNGAYVDPVTHKNLLQATLENLKAQGICFDQVILAAGTIKDKNPRFQAATSGVYPPNGQGMVYDKVLPAHPILAYFGDNIQDFPGSYQAEMHTQDPNGKAYDVFGKSYFVLPNPVYGSWEDNTFK